MRAHQIEQQRSDAPYSTCRAFAVLLRKVFKMNKIRNWGSASLATVSGAAMAAVPADVTSALASIQEDALTVAGVVLLAIVAVFAFKFLRKGL